MASDMHMTHDLPPLDWHAFFHTWTSNPGGLALCALLALGYLLGLENAVRRGGLPVHPVRIACFLTGVAVLGLCLSSSIDAYAMSLFWMHMIEHLTLITVVPALLVLGHPLTVARSAGGESWQRSFDRLVGRGPLALLTHPLVGIAAYTGVIFYTHLTPFMDVMARHEWAMSAEKVAYVVSGWMLLVSVIGEEPVRWRTPYLLRLVYLVIAMVPDTLVGIVLLQTQTNPFPTYMRQRPDWAPASLHDLQIGGSLMWAAGDGLMMTMAIGIVVTLLTGRSRERLLGPWLESARTHTFSEHVRRSGATYRSGETEAPSIDDDDAALAAYNDMLRRMGRPDGE